jgi:hypothetical protein
LDGTARANKNSVTKIGKKSNEEQVDNFDWIRKYRTWARKWQRKQNKKLERQGKKPKDAYYESDSGLLFSVRIPLFSSATVRGYNLKTQKLLKRDLTEAVKFKVNRVVEQSSDRIYAEGGFIPPQAAIPGDSSPEVGEDVNDFGTNTVEKNIDEGGKYSLGCNSTAYLVPEAFPLRAKLTCFRFSARSPQGF